MLCRTLYSAWVGCRQSKDYVALPPRLIFWGQRCAIILPLSDIYRHLRYRKNEVNKKGILRPTWTFKVIYTGGNFFLTDHPRRPMELPVPICDLRSL